MITLYATPTGYYRIPVLMEDARQTWPDVIAINEVEYGARLACYVGDGNPGSDQDWQYIVDNHDPARTTAAEYQEIQNQGAQEAASALFRGLRQLTPTDAAYAALARALAYRFGATQAEIDGITDRATGAAYITSTPSYQAISAPQIQAAASLDDIKAILEGLRQWQIAELEAFAIILQTLIPLVVRD